MTRTFVSEELVTKTRQKYGKCELHIQKKSSDVNISKYLNLTFMRKFDHKL